MFTKLLLFISFFFLFLCSSAHSIFAADICCLPGHVPVNNTCVNSTVYSVCNTIATKICSGYVSGQLICGLIPQNTIFNSCTSAAITAGSAITPSVICDSILSTLGLGSVAVIDFCTSIVSYELGPLKNLGTAITTPSLCQSGFNGKFYFCFANGNADKPGIFTALGCIPYETVPFVSATLTWSLGVGGGIAFLVIVWGSVLIITGGHDPKKIQAGQEMITAAISGMVMIIMCILIINYLGDKVLNLGPLGFRQ